MGPTAAPLMDPARIPPFIGFLAPEDPRWAQALDRTPHDFFHLPGYLRASATHEGGDPVLLLADYGDAGLLIPLLRRSLAEFGPAFAQASDLTSPYGYPGPLAWGANWEARLPELREALEGFLRAEGVVSLFLRLNPMVGPAPDLLAQLGEVKPHGPTIYIDLRGEDGGWLGINGANRRFIQQTLRLGCEVRFDQWDTAPHVIEAYYETMRRLDASPYYHFPRAFFELLREQGHGHLHLATLLSPGGEVAGGCYFTEVGGLLQYYLMGAFSAYRDLSPSKLLIDGIRRWGVARGHHTLHLGGGLGAREDDLFQFKVRFSKHRAAFATLRKVLLADTYQALARERGIQEDEDGFFPCYRKPRQVVPAPMIEESLEET